MRDTHQDGLPLLNRVSEKVGQTDQIAATRFRVVVAKSSAAVLNLHSEIEELLAQTGYSDEIVITPSYFLARAREKNARPFVVAVYNRDQLVGIVYGLRRCVFQIPVGLIESGDSCGDTSVLAREDCFHEVVDAALSRMAREPFTVLARISWNSNLPGREARHKRDFSGFVTRALNLDVWSQLSLEVTYERFLSTLGSETRHNMRSNRRRAEQAGWIFVKDLGSAEAAAALDTLCAFQSVGRTSRKELQGFQDTLRDVPGSFFAGLQTSGGEWTSLMGGWVKGKNMFIFLQLNNATYAKASVSAVLRGYVIERAIQSGILSIKFIDGCGGILRKYTRVSSSHVLMQRQHFLGRLFARLICARFPLSTFTRLLSESKGVGLDGLPASQKSA